MIGKGRKAYYEIIPMWTQFRQVIGLSSNNISVRIEHKKSWYQAENSRQSELHV